MTNPPDVADDLMQITPGFLIVGLGASAGGIEALHEFFTHVLADSGIAYVVILHLSPEHESQLANILQTVTPLPVTTVTETVRVEPNHVYVVSPSQHLTMVDGELRVSPNILLEERRAPVDIFFRTLAETHHSRAVSVVLSGTGADGSMGLKRIKERGGVVFVQNPREATFNEMPRSAIATDLVDDVLPVAAIPARIMAYQASLGTIAIPEEADQRPEEQQQALREIFTYLRVRTGHDFSNYKRPTLLRRITRRINVRNLSDLPAYAEFVRDNPDEVQALLKDLLISVTNFFRDKEAFAALEQEILPRVFGGKRADEQVRIWVVGCATGEEAYSIAMLCAERVLGAIDSPSVQIFASDIDEAAIAHAREGLYTINDAADVSPERLRRFFTLEDKRYRIRREIREMVLFANHNVLKDPPFSHLDLVTCRNMLIYLNHSAQERVMETLHFALNPGGYLFLGTSESVDGSNDLFATVSREQHIFQSRPTGTRPLPVPDAVPISRANPVRLSLPVPSLDERSGERTNYDELQQRLLEQYAPPSVVVNEDYTVVRLSERVGRYLQIAGKQLSNNLLQLVRPELRLDLRSALYGAVQRQTNVQIGPLPVRIDERAEMVTIHVHPVLRHDDPARGFLLVVFEQSAATARDAEPMMRADEPVVRQLEDEVQRLRQQLRTSSEQYEYQTEELKATNEELQALNEELRSSTEELETSKEELQSINEELRTVNQELKVKVEEATLYSTNLQNLVNSTDIGTIFLDRGLRVKLFTPAARDLFNLIPADYGRPLADITHRLFDVDVLADAETVLEKLQTIEREARTSNGRVYLLRVLPYRAGEDRIGGVVITFFDMTERKRAEESVRASEAKYRTLFDSIDEGFHITELIYDESGKAVDYRFLEVNQVFERQTGLVNVAGTLGSDIAPHTESHWLENYDRVVRTGEPLRFENYSEDTGRWYSAYVSRIGGEGSHQIAVVFDDITERKWQEQRQEYLLKLSDTLRAQSSAVSAEEAVTRLALEHFDVERCYFVTVENKQAIVHRDATLGDIPSVAGVYPLESFPLYQHVLDAGRPFVVQDVATTDVMEEGLKAICLALNLVSSIQVPVLVDGMAVGILCLVQSVPRVWTEAETALATETGERLWAAISRTRAEAALRASEAKYRALFDSIDEGFCTIEVLFDESGTAYDYRFLETNPAFVRQTGIENGVGRTVREFASSHEAFWFEIYGRIARTGEAMRFEHAAAALNPPRYYDVYAFRIGAPEENRVAVIFNDISERKQWERELTRTNQLLQAMFDNSLQIIQLFKAVRDERGDIVDFEWLMANERWNELYGEMAGKRLLAQNPAVIETGLFDAFKQVTETGVPVTQEHFYNYEQFDGWFLQTVAKVEDGFLLSTLDITERKQAEQRQEYLLKLSDALRPISDSVEIQAAVTRVTMQYFNAGRCYYCEIEQGNAIIRYDSARGDLPSVVGEYPVGDMPIFKAVLDAGRPFVVQDAHTNDLIDEYLRELCIQLQVISFIDVPVIKDGRPVGVLCITQSAPRDWTTFDVDLAVEIAERTWAAVERAKAEAALRESEEKYHTLFDSIDEGYALFEVLYDAAGKPVDLFYVETNPAFERMNGFSGTGKKLGDVLGKLEPFWYETYDRVVKTGEPTRVEYSAELTGAWYSVYCSRIGGAGSTRLAVVFDDITERKRREANQQLLVNISADLGRLSDEEAIIRTVGAKLADYLQLPCYHYVDVNEERGEVTLRFFWHALQVPYILGTYPIAGFISPYGLDILRSGGSAVVNDVQNDVTDDSAAMAGLKAGAAAQKIGAYVAVPYSQDGRWKAYFAVADSSPRQWTSSEIEVIQQVSNLTFPRIERARVEEALRIANERFHIAEEASNGFVYDWDTQTGTVTRSEGFTRVLGYAPGEIEETAAGWIELIHPDDQIATEAITPAALDRAQSVVAAEYRVRAKDGRYVYVLDSGLVMRDEAGMIVRIVGSTTDITERKRAEEALRNSEVRFRAAFEQANVGIVQTTIDGRILVPNPGFCEIIGYTEEEAKNLSVHDITHPDDYDSDMEQARRVIAGEITGYAIEKRYIRKTNETVWVQMTSTLVRNASGEPYYALAIVVDINEQKLALEALRESEARFRTLADAVPQVIWANNADGKAIYFNQRWYDYSGLSYEESFGPGWQVIVHPDDAPASVERWQRALAEGIQFDAEYRLRRSDGTYRWFIGRNVPLHDESDRIVGWFGSATDIEDLKQAEAARHESEERFRLLVEGARDYAMFLLDPENRITYWSVGAERVFGYTEAEALGQRGTIIFTPEDRTSGQLEREMQTALDQGSTPDRRWHIRKDGTRLFLDGTLIRLDDAVGKLRGFVKIGRDATAQRQAEEALQRAHDQLESRVQERTSELAAANHLLQQEIAERRELAAQRTVLMERILTEQETEWQRIARELHDTLGQFLSALNMRLSMSQSREGIPSHVSEELAQLLALSIQIDREVDRLTMELRPPALEDFGLVDALRSYTEEWRATSGVSVDLLVIGLDNIRLNSLIETTVYRIVQEALTNVLKHAQASVVSVVVERQSGALRVIVEDNGVGFEASVGIAPGVGGRQVGLIGMSERAALVGGELTIETAPGAGTTIYLHISLGEDTKEGTGNAHE